MKPLLRLKSWQTFIVLIFSTILIFIVSIFNLSIDDWSRAQTIEFFRIVGLLIYTLWLFFLGLELNRKDNNPYRFNNLLLAFASFSFFTGYASINLAVFPAFETLPFSIRILSMPLTFFGLIFLFYNIPMSLKSIELDRKVKYSECLFDVLLLFSSVIGIGIWWLQPRMNKIEKKLSLTKPKKTCGETN